MLEDVAAIGRMVPMSKGLLIVNVQNDLVNPDGGLYYAAAHRLPKKIAAYVRDMGSTYDHLYAVKDWHEDSHRCAYTEDDIYHTPHCDEGTKGAELHPEIQAVSHIFTNVFHDKSGYPLDAECVNPVTGDKISHEKLWDALVTDDIDELHIVGVGEAVNSVVFDIGDIEVHVLAPLVAGSNEWCDPDARESFYLRGGLDQHETGIVIDPVLDSLVNHNQPSLF